MKYSYLNDADFLELIDLQHLKKQYVKIIILDWEENPIQDITGKIIGGSINIDGNSSIRRTANITMFTEDIENNITNVNSLLSINKKVSVEVGYLNTTSYYKEYPIIWFPAGIYVIIQPSISHGTGGTTISLQLKDKMVLLNGECGGTLPAAVTFNEIETYDDDGNIIITYPTMYQIIQEAVNHWGGEQLGKIIISDLDTRVKQVMKWWSSTPLYCYNEGNGIEFTTNENTILKLEANGIHESQDFSSVLYGDSYIKYEKGRDVGFIYTDFIYLGGEMVGEAGSTVCDVLDIIKNTLGNYEYFYDIDGNFVFQEIKNYLNISHSTTELNRMSNNSYLIDQSKGKTVYKFNDSTLVTSYSNTPQFNMIKNDFIVWGVRKDAEGHQWPIRYHLAIDKKPEIGKTHTVFQYEDPEDGLLKAKATQNYSSKDEFPKKGKPGVFYHAIGSAEVYTKSGSSVFTDKKDKVKIEDTGIIYQWDAAKQEYVEIKNGKLGEITSKDWRTELYLQGADTEPYGIQSNYYYTELQGEWPKLYNVWGDNPGFYQEVLDTPSDCDFFLDFIDSTAAIGEFSVNNIGRRTKAVVDDSINCLFEPEIPDLVILEENSEDIKERREECEDRGQNYTQVDSSIYQCLTGGGNLNSAYVMIRSLLYEYTSYNESITIQSIPLYHLDVNTRVEVTDPNSNIFGDYIIHTISIPLDIGSTMSISATRALERF